MASLIAAFLLAAVGIVLTFLTLTFLGIETAVAGSVAATIIGGVPYIHQTIEKSGGLSRKHSTEIVVSLQGFGIAVHRLLVYSILLMFSAVQCGGLVSGLFAGIFQTDLAGLGSALGIGSLFITMPLIFLIGRWMGRRAVAHGIVIVIVAALISRLIVAIFDATLISHDNLAKMFDEEIGVRFFLEQLLYGTLVYSAFGLLGYWRGRRQQLSSYLGYLLGQVSEDTQKIIVELAFEEARRHSHTISPSVNA